MNISFNQVAKVVWVGCQGELQGVEWGGRAAETGSLFPSLVSEVVASHRQWVVALRSLVNDLEHTDGASAHATVNPELQPFLHVQIRATSAGPEPQPHLHMPQKEPHHTYQDAHATARGSLNVSGCGTS
eukprot:1140770-Pelagomonas_calceolata.AAC.1